MSEGIEERGEGPGRAQLVTVTAEHDYAQPLALGGAGVEDRRLPDAGLAFEEQHLPCALTRVCAERAEECEGSFSPYEHPQMVLADGLGEFTDDGTGFSAEYSTRAARLKESLEALGRSQRIFRQVSQPVPAQWRELEEQVSREVAFQRSQLESLAFHEPEVQARMLGLLPEAP